MQPKYHTFEVIEKAHAGARSFQIVRAQYLGLELYILESRGVGGDDMTATPFLSQYTAQAALHKQLRHFGGDR